MNVLLKIKKIPKRYRMASAGWVSRFMLGFSQIISISILLTYLGTDLYAVFVTLIGLQSWFLLVDCGVGSSLQNCISEARANNQSDKEYLYNAVIISLALLVAFCLLFTFISPFLQYYLLHKIAPSLARSNYYLLITVGIIFIATNVFAISYRVLYANHKGHLAYFYQGVAPAISVVAVLIIKYINFEHNKLLISILGWLLPQLFVALVSYFRSFSFTEAAKHYNIKIIKAIMFRGVKFWGYSIFLSFVLVSDYIVMSQTLAVRDITIYNILAKGLAMILVIYTSVLTIIWPEIAELFAKKQWEIANRILTKNILLGVIFVSLCALMFYLFKHIVMLFLAPKMNLTLPSISIFLLGIYAVIRVWTDSYTVALQSQNHLRIFWLYIPVQALIAIVSMYYLSIYFGLNGIFLGLILSFLSTSSWILPVYYFKIKR